MSAIKEEDLYFLRQYNYLLEVMQEGFDYLEEKWGPMPPVETQRVLTDIIHSFQQLNQSHKQIKDIMKSQGIEFSPYIDDFESVINELFQWMEIETNHEKENALVQRVIPKFSDWRQSIGSLLQPYISH
ncbi:hypothetical protein RZN22_05610 [Bacillaceae bacterium S4-13-58]